jgi:hypothetical protein
VTCVAVRDRTAYLGQLGPAVAYHLGDGRVSRIVPEDEATEPLGLPEQIEPRFTRFELSPGDLLLIASPAIDRVIDTDTLRATLLKGGDEALVELFRLTRGEQEFSLILLACVVEPEGATEPDAIAAPPALDALEAPGGESIGAEVTAGEAPEEGQPEPTATAGASPAATAILIDPSVSGPADVAPADGIAPPEGLSQPPVRLKGAESAVRYRRTTGIASALPRIPPLLIIGAILLIAAGLIAWFVIPGALEESREDEVAAQIEETRSSLDQALASPDVAERRALLRAADAALLDAERLRPDDPEVIDLRNQVDAAIADLNAVVELPALELVADVSEQVPGPVSSRGLALGGGGAYFLDQSQGRVIAVALVGGAPEPFVLFETGDLVGNEIMGTPQQIAWAEDLNALLIMDDQRRVAAVTPPGEAGQLLTVRDIQSLGSADGIAYNTANLYVLDRAGDQVWRYPPSEGGFDSERSPLVSGTDLEQALEMAIADSLYLVIGDNSIVRVVNGAAEPLSLAGIDMPLSSPGSVVPIPDQNIILVADRGGGNPRIVVLNSDGSFRGQWSSPSFTDLRAISYDEAANLLYVLSGTALYRTPLPVVE